MKKKKTSEALGEEMALVCGGNDVNDSASLPTGTTVEQKEWEEFHENLKGTCLPSWVESGNFVKTVASASVNCTSMQIDVCT